MSSREERGVCWLHGSVYMTAAEGTIPEVVKTVLEVGLGIACCCTKGLRHEKLDDFFNPAVRPQNVLKKRGSGCFGALRAVGNLRRVRGRQALVNWACC